MQRVLRAKGAQWQIVPIQMGGKKKKNLVSVMLLYFSSPVPPPPPLSTARLSFPSAGETEAQRGAVMNWPGFRGGDASEGAIMAFDKCRLMYILSAFLGSI